MKNKELGRVITAAEDQGWTVTRTKKNHLRFLAPAGAIYIASSTPSDKRAHRNICSDLRKRGLVI